MAFKKATREKVKLRLAIHGPSGSGKTFSALAIAQHLADAEGGRVAVLDTERDSARMYAGELDESGKVLDFDVDEAHGDYNPKILFKAFTDVAESGHSVFVVDSFTHFWNGPGGILEMVDAEVKRMASKGQKPDSFAAWKAVTPAYNRIVNTILTAPFHVIVCMRAKQEYEKEKDDRGKTVIKKLGMAPEMRDSFIYESGVEAAMDMEHSLVVGKTRIRPLDGQVIHKPGKEFAETFLRWLDGGAVPMAPIKKFLSRIDSLETERDAKMLGVEVKTARAGGILTEEECETLRPLFETKLSELKAASEAA